MPDGRTFYDVLGVDADADRETIQRAYRERVKEFHPDVSDHPNARERFKRITRAKTVLTDRRERKRYDRLGHEAYLERERSGQTDREDGDDEVSTPSYSTDPTATGGREDRTDSYSRAASDPSSQSTAGTADADGTTQGSAGQRSGPHGDPMTETESRSAAGGAGPPGRFALREAISIVPVGIAAAVSVALALVPRVSTIAAGVLLASWVVVAAVAGRLAAGSASALPDDVVRAHAFPLVVLVAAWYVALGTDYRLVAVGLAAYGLFAAVFRAAALTSSGGSALWPSSLWYLATAPGAVVVYVTLTDRPGVLSDTLSRVVASTPGPVGGEPVVAVVAAVLVVFGHALWRLGRLIT
jgi:curved DNA-binding protein CbpA